LRNSKFNLRENENVYMHVRLCLQMIDVFWIVSSNYFKLWDYGYYYIRLAMYPFCSRILQSISTQAIITPTRLCIVKSIQSAHACSRLCNILKPINNMEKHKRWAIRNAYVCLRVNPTYRSGFTDLYIVADCHIKSSPAKFGQIR
jgi:hypothetical protein